MVREKVGEPIRMGMVDHGGDLALRHERDHGGLARAAVRAARPFHRVA
jgi:hypothetical protein